MINLYKKFYIPNMETGYTYTNEVSYDKIRYTFPKKIWTQCNYGKKILITPKINENGILGDKIQYKIDVYNENF